MSLPTAPVAILVLAWDETTPAVRAVIDATEIPEPTIDSVVVVVPSAPPSPEPTTQEEFLPLAANPELLPALLTAPAITPTPPETPNVLLSSNLPPTLPTTEPAAVAATTPISAPPPVVAPRPVPSPAATFAAAQPTLPAWTAVRVLRLSSFSLAELALQAGQPLPAPVWTGFPTVPTAPYVGSEALISPRTVSKSLSAQPIRSATPSALVPVVAPPLPHSAAPAPARVSSALPLFNPTEVAPPCYLPTEELPVGSDFEQDDLPLATEPDLLPDFTPELTEFAEHQPTPFAPEQANWPDALAALALQPPTATQPTSPTPSAVSETLTSATETTAVPHPALRVVDGAFEAPNLNFQVIQYARFAVPVALAEAEFAAIYAPAWPTWLAAQELRQRTGQPLVLHVSTLAAAEEESVATATSWQAELQRQSLHRADLILTETPALAKRLRHDLELPATAVRTIPAADATAIAQAVASAQVRPTGNRG